MKGKYGVSMNTIVYRDKPKGNRRCKDCMHLTQKATGYWCKAKKRNMYYTSVCYCKKFFKEKPSSAYGEAPLVEVISRKGDD